MAADRGLYNKFSKIERTDGRHLPGKKHSGCRYFVIDLDHDEFAQVVMMEYANQCQGEYPTLASDIIRWFSGERTTEFGKAKDGR